MEETREIKAFLSLQKKLFILQSVSKFKSIHEALRFFQVPKSSFYKWKQAFVKYRENFKISKDSTLPMMFIPYMKY